jgi:glycogenin glucosyltransferase
MTARLIAPFVVTMGLLVGVVQQWITRHTTHEIYARNTAHSDLSLCHNIDFKPTHKRAVWTMLTDDPHYVNSTLKLGRSLRTHTSDVEFDMVWMELSHKPLSHDAWTCLREVGWQRCVVHRIVPLDETSIQMYEPRFLDQFTKLHLWSMTMYETLVYLDSDTLTLRSIRHLLHHNMSNKSIAAVAQTWHGMFQGFNMGVFVIRPSRQEYERLLEIQRDPAVQFEAHWAEQGLLNVVYKDKWDDLGFANNALAWTSWQRSAYWREQYPTINVIHYVGLKPWTCVPDVLDRVFFANPSGYTHLCQVWWDAPCECTAS